MPPPLPVCQAKQKNLAFSISHITFGVSSRLILNSLFTFLISTERHNIENGTSTNIRVPGTGQKFSRTRATKVFSSPFLHLNIVYTPLPPLLALSHFRKKGKANCWCKEEKSEMKSKPNGSWALYTIFRRKPAQKQYRAS